MKARRNALLLIFVLLAGFSSLTAQDAPTPAATGLIVGRVVDAESGKPVSGATVAINAARDTGREPKSADVMLAPPYR